MIGLQIHEVNLSNPNEIAQVEEYLNKFNLKYEKDIDYSIFMKDNDKVIGTCSKSKNILKGFAVDEGYQGQGVSSTMVTAMLDEMFNENIYHSFVFTKNSNKDIFTSMGFKVLYEAEEVILLEHGIYDINSYLDKLIDKYSIDTTLEKAALVMNCNPFTLGHRYLLEKASQENNEVLVFIVEEDKSTFPFEQRLNLVTEGVKDLKNVKVIAGGEYIISSATFPSYFLREEGSKLKAYTQIDAGIFSKFFSKKLNITKRYVGNEPYCQVTRAYNAALKEILNNYHIEVIEVDRLELAHEAVSASKVRSLLKSNDLQEVRKIVPKVTWDFINTQKGKEIVEKLKNTDAPH